MPGLTARVWAGARTPRSKRACARWIGRGGCSGCTTARWWPTRPRTPKSGWMAATIRMAPQRCRAPSPIWRKMVDRPLYLICGMLKTKDAVGFLSRLQRPGAACGDGGDPGRSRQPWARARFTTRRARRGWMPRRPKIWKTPCCRSRPGRGRMRGNAAAHSDLRLAVSGGKSAGGERLIHCHRPPECGLSRCSKL